MDLGNIYIVLQWLVKKLIESRDERNIKSKVTANFYYENILENLVKKKEKKEIKEIKEKKIFNPILQNKNKIQKFKENIINDNINKDKENSNKSLMNENQNENEFNEKKKSNLNFIKIHEQIINSKYNITNKGRIFKPLHNYDFQSNDPLRIYFNLIEYGMNKDITFQRNLIDLLKKKGLVDDSKLDKDKDKDKDREINKKTNQEKEKDSNNNNAEISLNEKKKLDEIISSNIVEVNNNNNKINNNIIEEIFTENLDEIINEIDK